MVSGCVTDLNRCDRRVNWDVNEIDSVKDLFLFRNLSGEALSVKLCVSVTSKFLNTKPVIIGA